MIKINDYKLEIASFPNNEAKIKFKREFFLLSINGDINIYFLYENDKEILYLLFIVDFIKNEYPNNDIVLFMPYVPYSRQDRLFTLEAFTLKTFCNLINSCGFYKVYISNPHSDVTMALINNVENVYNPNNIFNIVKKEVNFKLSLIKPEDLKFYIVSPDVGAYKKTYKIYSDNKEKIIDLIQATKVRCTDTGKILETKIVNYPNKNDDYPVIIIDDICDGGATFIEIAKLLKKQNELRAIVLYVTHGFFTRGLDVFDGLIDYIYINKFEKIIKVKGE